jgi:hypothetical protein
LAIGNREAGKSSYRQVLRLAADERFAKLEDVQAVVRAVKEMLEMLVFMDL